MLSFYLILLSFRTFATSIDQYLSYKALDEKLKSISSKNSSNYDMISQRKSSLQNLTLLNITNQQQQTMMRFDYVTKSKKSHPRNNRNECQLL